MTTFYYVIEATYPVNLKEIDLETLIGRAPDGHWVVPFSAANNTNLPVHDMQTLEWDYFNLNEAKEAFNLLCTHPNTEKISYMEFSRYTR